MPVSPQRFVSAHEVDSPTHGDDSVDPAELAERDGGLEFVVTGLPGEDVEVTLVRPAETVLAVAITIAASGHVTVACSTAGACTQR